MKVLVLGSRIPYPLRDGGAKASYQLLQILHSLNYEVTFFSFNTKKHFAKDELIKDKFSFCRVITHELDGTVKPLKALWNLLIGRSYNLSRFSSPEAQNKLRGLLENESFDVVHFESLFTIPFLETVSKYHKGQILLRQHNAENRIWEKLAKTSTGLKKWYVSTLARQLKKEEEVAISKFDVVVGISQEDTDYFKQFNPHSQYISVAQDQREPLSSLNPHMFCHIGSMEWQPNVQAVSWFLENVWDRIMALNPQSEFHIAGKSLDKGDDRFIKPGVINHGEVADSTQFLANYGTLVIPLQSASGVRMKAIEAMSIGVPVISTEVGVSGLDVNHGAEVLLANSPDEMVECIQQILESETKALEIAKSGWNYVNQNFSIQALSHQWQQLYSKMPNQ